MKSLRMFRPAVAIAGLSVLTGAMASAQYTFVKIKVPVTGAGNAAPYGISNQNDIVGLYSIKGQRGVIKSFLRTGTKPPQWTFLGDPASDGKITAAYGVNSSRTVVGYFQPSRGVFDGFLYTGGVYSSIVEPGCKDTEVDGINDHGDLAGYCYMGRTSEGWVYTSSNNSTTFFAVPGASNTVATALNSSDQVGGFYQGGPHVVGFVRASNGTITTYDYPGSVPSWLWGISDVSNRGDQWISGYFENPDGSFHGYLNLNGTYSQIDVPGAKSTTVTGVNVRGWFVGVYQDTLGHYFGYYAKPSSGASVLIDEE